jgi:hypothetical protein
MPLNLLDASATITVSDADLDGVPDGVADTTYTVRQIPPDESRKVVLAHTKKVLNKRTGRMDEITDEYDVTLDLLDRALVDWTGIGINGEAVPCTREHKLKLDGVRRTALLQIAGLNRSAEVRAESFRGAS